MHLIGSLWSVACDRLKVVCVCVWGGGGILLCNLQVVIPGTLTTVMPIACHGSDGLASRAVPSDTSVSLKTKACKTNVTRKSVSLFHAKSKTRIGCWNVHTLGALSGQSEKLRSVLRTMKEKRIEIVAMSESRWPGEGITKIQSYTILHSGTPSSHVYGIALALSPNAHASWKAAGSVFHIISDRIISVRIKTHYTFATILAVYAPTNPINTTQEARAPSVTFYDQLQSSIASVPQNDMIIVLGDFNACVGGTPDGCPAVGPHGLDDCNENGDLL